MDDRGNIRTFENASDALKAGFKHNLSGQQAEILSNIEKEDRLPELVYLAYRKAVLKERKVETMEKMKIKSAIEFTLKFIKDSQ